MPMEARLSMLEREEGECGAVSGAVSRQPRAIDKDTSKRIKVGIVTPGFT